MILSIENSTSNLSLTLLINNQVINKVSIQIKNDLSEIIIPTIKNFIKNNSITFLNISLLVVGCGPGSFTGIRAVISAAKGIYLSNKHMKIIGINSLAGLAMSALIEAKNRNIKYIIAWFKERIIFNSIVVADHTENITMLYCRGCNDFCKELNSRIIFFNRKHRARNIT